MDGHGAINDTARALFAPLGGDYDRWAAILSFAQDPRWRRFLVEHVPVGPDATVLDVATGTGAIARALVRRYGCRVVGVDQSPQMLEGARERIGRQLADRIELRLGSAEELDFEEGSFDALTAGYLLRYVDDPLADHARPAAARTTGRALRAARLLRAAQRRRARGLASLHRRRVCPCWVAWSRPVGPMSDATCVPASRPSMRPTRPRTLRELLIEAGAANVNTRLMSLGGGLVAWGVRAVR